MMRKPYFKKNPGDPPPLRVTVERKVRFDEVDMMGIVWHGRYAGYFEDARVAMGDAVGLGYMNYYENGVVTPIKQLHLDYNKPLVHDEPFTTEAIMHWSDAARINMEFIIRNSKGEVATNGYSIQLMLNLDGELLLAQPDCHRALCKRWLEGELAELYPQSACADGKR